MGSGDYIATHSAVEGGEQSDSHPSHIAFNNNIYLLQMGCHLVAVITLSEQPQYSLDSKLGGTRASLVAMEKIKKSVDPAGNWYLLFLSSSL
jgi:hypothetical protein